MNRQTLEMLNRLQTAGITLDDALALRRIAMTLQHWFELECGNSNNYSAWVIVRGRRDKATKEFIHDDDETPFIKRQYYYSDKTKTSYDPLPDRENGARKRLAKILAKYPGFQAYVQTDPRGASLYILRPGDIRPGSETSTCYTNGIAVYK